ncbi:MAG: hypothetical protein K8Q91_03575 [Candidatus Vogelbacteria bacterium]|nr:hypothetical protein [Candidatus Vogelbacteria bacterium]
MPITGKSTQDFVPIKEIRDGVVILRDGGLRLVLIASSINFALKSADEKTAILLQYQNFLNSLDFHIQIFIQSRRLDISPYISTLEVRLKEQTNELLKVQTREYIGFIKSFTENNNVMTKTFFISIPYEPAVYKNKDSLFNKIVPASLFGQKNNTVSETDNFQENRAQLEQRVDVVKQGLNRIGVRTEQLGTEELVELYFKLFNPGEKTAPTV